MEYTSGSERTIVIVEDNPADVVLVWEALQAHGIAYDLETYERGEDALAGLARHAAGELLPTPALVLLDWNLPAIGGADVLRAIRESGEFRCLPVAVLTSSGSPTDRAEAMRLGATRYIQKPMGFDEFIDQIGHNVLEMIG
jgi:CheY-like chemotaxis protein